MASVVPGCDGLLPEGAGIAVASVVSDCAGLPSVEAGSAVASVLSGGDPSPPEGDGVTEGQDGSREDTTLAA